MTKLDIRTDAENAEPSLIDSVWPTRRRAEDVLKKEEKRRAHRDRLGKKNDAWLCIVFAQETLPKGTQCPCRFACKDVMDP